MSFDQFFTDAIEHICYIKISGLSVLMKAVANSLELKSLSVSGSNIDVTSAKAAAYALSYNQSLKSLFLVHCTIGPTAYICRCCFEQPTSAAEVNGF